MNFKGSALVVDRNYMVAESIAAALETHGYSAMATQSYGDAGRRLVAEVPVLIVAHGGWGRDQIATMFIELAMSICPQVPMIITSSGPTTELHLPQGQWGYIHKPFDLQELMRVVAATEISYATLDASTGMRA
jgi:DNA-binding response OmpR family regulator